MELFLSVHLWLSGLKTHRVKNMAHRLTAPPALPEDQEIGYYHHMLLKTKSSSKWIQCPRLSPWVPGIMWYRYIKAVKQSYTWNRNKSFKKPKTYIPIFTYNGISLSSKKRVAMLFAIIWVNLEDSVVKWNRKEKYKCSRAWWHKPANLATQEA